MVFRNTTIDYTPCCIWLTGLSGSGKTTLSLALKKIIRKQNIPVYLLDGDKLRNGLNSDLGYSEPDRKENIRRAGEVSKLFVNEGYIVLAAFISPFQNDRNFVRSLFQSNKYFEIFIDCPIETCEKRDPKGLYKKARNGEINSFTGISSPYEIPNKADLIIRNNNDMPINTNAQLIFNFLESKKIIK